MNFRLSETTKAYLKQNQNKKTLFRVKNPQYYNSPEFYKKRPDLAPRNIYLRTGRILKHEDIQKELFRYSNSWWDRLLYQFKNFFDRIRK